MELSKIFRKLTGVKRVFLHVFSTVLHLVPPSNFLPIFIYIATFNDNIDLLVRASNVC
jgi:hypothetical protein